MRRPCLESLRSKLLIAACCAATACGGKSTDTSGNPGGGPGSGGSTTTGAGGATITGATTGAGGDGTTGGAAGTGTSGGAAGEGGGAGTTSEAGGSAGEGGAAGSGGSTGGQAGRGGAGGAAGGAVADGGAGGAKAECQTAKDCRLASDCCSCEAVAVGEAHVTCDAICPETKCQADGLPADSVACVAGQCVAGFECDASKVLCRIAPPTCGPGLVPSVKDSCYSGACVPANECASVTSCAACGSSLACAAFSARPGPSYHCVSIPAACKGNATCGCMGPAVCTGFNSSCGDLSGVRGVTCSCPTC